MSGDGMVHECQFPRCGNLASWYVRRGERHNDLQVCGKHRDEFREMTNREALAIHEGASARRSYRVGVAFGIEQMR